MVYRLSRSARALGSDEVTTELGAEMGATRNGHKVAHAREQERHDREETGKYIQDFSTQAQSEGNHGPKLLAG